MRATCLAPGAVAWLASIFEKGDSTTMKNLNICAGLTALSIFIASADAGLAANTGGPHILVVDRKALFTTSKLGQNISQQLMGYEQKAQSELGPEGQALQSQRQALESAKLSPDARTKQQQALQAKQAAFQQKVRDRQSMIQGGQMAARKYFMDQLDAVCRALMAERGADAVLDKSNVVASASGGDVTKDVIARLDKKAPSFKVPMVKPSLSDMLQMQSMQQQQQQQ